ncbi:MAG: hypothetical protein WC641_01470 [Patescibacteria group bacterium]
MGLGRLTALEIFAHPTDLMFVIGQADGRFGILLTRVPGHDYKLLISSQMTIETRDKAVEILCGILDTTIEAGQRTYAGSDDVGEILNPDKVPVEKFPALTKPFADRIKALLRTADKVETYLLDSAAS